MRRIWRFLVALRRGFMVGYNASRSADIRNPIEGARHAVDVQRNRERHGL